MSEVLDRATRAKAVLENAAYQEAYEHVHQKLLSGLEALPISATAEAEDLRKCLKLLGYVRANMERAINSGKIELSRMNEQEERRKNPLRGMFNRGIRR